MICVFRIEVEDTMDPRVKPEDDDLECLFYLSFPQVLSGNPICVFCAEDSLYPQVKSEDDNINYLGLRVIVWVISYLFKHAGKDFQSQVLFVT